MRSMWLLIIFLICLLIAATYYNYITTVAKVQKIEEIDLEQLKQKMKFHGTLIIFKDKDGKWKFYRNGKKCLLW